MPPPEPLPVDLADALQAARSRLTHLASTVVYFPTIGSTNDAAAAIAIRPGGEGAVVVADAQTSGRGRRGRAWFSPPLSGLYVSVVLAPARARRDADRALQLVTLTAGVALAEAIEHATGLRPAIKWPNDLLLGRRKLGGILAEGVSAASGEMRVVVGYGINVWPAAYPPELADRATSLESELGRAIDRASLWVETLAALSARYDDLIGERYDAILDAWRARAPSCEGARVAWEIQASPPTTRSTITGVTAGVDAHGALLVRVGDRIERLVAGEVTWMS
jgi:BirA family biotin operon repressor/biotin-[acetyl-CoA-carboxylase] ligase